MRAFYFKGLRLPKRGEGWEAVLARGGGGEAVGVKRTWATRNPESPNYRADVVVETQIPLVAAIADLDAAETLDAIVLQTTTSLVGLSSSAGHLSRVRDTDRRADVTGGPYTGSVAVSHDAFDDAWTPEVGRLLLVRNPSAGAGFVAEIAAVGVGTVTIDLGSESVSSAWELLEVVSYYPTAVFETWSPGRPDVRDRSDEWRSRVAWTFTAYGAPVFASAHAITPE